MSTDTTLTTLPTTSGRARIAAGYAAFGVFCFVLFLYLTFPYDAVKERVAAEVGQAGLFVRMGSLGPGLFGVTATDVQLSPKMGPGDEKPSPPLILKSVAARPSLFPLGVALRIKALDGVVHAALGVVGDPKVRVTLDDLNLKNENLKAFTGLDLAGKLNGQFSLDIPKVVPPGGKDPEPDLGQADGTLTLDAAGLALNGGSITTPGHEMDFPQVVFGDLESKLDFKKGLGTLDKLKARGKDLDLAITGTLKLAKRVDYSELNLEVRLKPQPDFQKKWGLILSNLQLDPQNPDFRIARITGFLGRPNAR